MSNIVEKIIEIDNEIRCCKLCDNMVDKYVGITTVSFGKSNQILLIGDAPIRKENKEFSQINEKLYSLDATVKKLFEILNLELNEIFYIEAMKCFLNDKRNINKCINNCRNFLLAQINIINPKIIFTLGDKATRSLLEYRDFNDIVGLPRKIIINEEEKYIIPLYSPLLRNYTRNKRIMKDLKKLYFVSEEVNTLKRKLY